jgi:hypothetical protein
MKDIKDIKSAIDIDKEEHFKDDIIDAESLKLTDVDKDFTIPKIKSVFKDHRDLTVQEKSYIDKRIFDSANQKRICVETLIIKSKINEVKFSIERIWNEDNPLIFTLNMKKHEVKEEDAIASTTTQTIFEILDTHHLDINDVEISIKNDFVTRFS